MSRRATDFDCNRCKAKPGAECTPVSGEEYGHGTHLCRMRALWHWEEDNGLDIRGRR